MCLYPNKGNLVPKAGISDGDSVRFRTKDLKIWNRLEGRPVIIHRKK
jgi:hypothetical protein